MRTGSFLLAVVVVTAHSNIDLQSKVTVGSIDAFWYGAGLLIGTYHEKGITLRADLMP